MGEAIVTTALAWHGWIVRSLNAGMPCPNADLVAIKGKARVTLQVKAAPHPRHDRIRWLFLAGGRPRTEGRRFFNVSATDIQADYVAFVSYESEKSWQVFVVPVRVAEDIARKRLSELMSRPTREGGLRKAPPQIWLCLEPKRRRVVDRVMVRQAARMRRYLDKWGLLDGNA
jgi:hypothetical protein